MHQHPPKMLSCYSTRRANAGQVAGESGAEARGMGSRIEGPRTGYERISLPAEAASRNGRGPPSDDRGSRLGRTVVDRQEGRSASDRSAPTRPSNRRGSRSERIIWPGPMAGP